jgi:hypothetical protein
MNAKELEEQRQLALKRGRFAVYEIGCAIGYLRNLQPSRSKENGELQVMSLELVRIIECIEARR